MKYAISVVVHNNLELTKRCLSSILRHSEGQDYRLIVTDNASTDGTQEYLAKFFAEHSGWHFRNEKNLGFGEPHNKALEFVLSQPDPPKYFVVLNNDVEICAEWLQTMAGALEQDPKAAICGIHGACCALGEDGVGCVSGTVEYIEASCLMIRSDLAKKHGLFSPEFVFAYYEDSDLSLRMRQLGYKLVQVRLPIRHERAATAKIISDVDLKGFWIRNQKVFFEKWKDYLARRSFGARSIMIRRTSALGDVLLVTPILRLLQARYPGVEFTLVTCFPEVFRRDSSVVYAGNKMLKKPEKYDYFFDLDLAYEKRSQMHIVDAYAGVCGVSDALRTSGSRRPHLVVTEAEHSWAYGLLGESDIWVAIHPGPTAWPGRNWPQTRFAEVADHILSRGGKVALVGDSGAPKIPNTLDMRGKTTLHQLAALLGECDLFVGIDSAPMHVATAVETPVIAVFGCISPEYRLSGDDLLRAVTAPREAVGCLGCHHYLPAPRVSSDCFRFPNAKVPPCMEKLRTEYVTKKIDDFLRWTNG